MNAYLIYGVACFACTIAFGGWWWDERKSRRERR